MDVTPGPSAPAIATGARAHTLRVLPWLVFAVLVVLAIASVWHARGMACDDAYITFRYAANLLAGHGLRWNPTSAPCEGYSNLTYVLAIAGLGALGVAPPHAALLLAGASVLGLAAVLARAARPAGPLLPLALAPALLLWGRDDLVVHASRGLETIAFAFVATLQLCSIARLAGPAEVRTRHGLLAGAYGAVLFCTRPDGVLLTATCLLGAAWLVRRERARRRVLLVAVATWLACGVVYAAWKLAYFGYLLPNPFYAKAAMPGFAGVAETRAFAAAYAPLLLLAPITALAVALRAPAIANGRRDATAALGVAVALPWLAYGAKVVHEIGFAHRFAWPVAPVLALAAVRGMAVLGAATAPTVLARALAWIAFAAAIGAGAGTWRAQLGRLDAPPPRDPYVAAFVRLGEAIRDTGIAPQLTLFGSNAGAVPFVSGAHHVDPAGLTDDGYCTRTAPEERARYQRSLRFDVVMWTLFPASAGAACFADDARAQASTYVQRLWLADDRRIDTGARHLLAGKSRQAIEESLFLQMWVLREHASLLGEMKIGVEGTRLFVYVWKQSPHHDALVAHLAPRVDVPAAAIDYDGWPR